MLSHDTEEAQNGYLRIADIDYETCLEMLRFVYSGEAPNLNTIAADLLVAADKYSLVDLKQMCEQSLVKAINAENACELLILSDVHNATRLRQKSLEYIVQNNQSVSPLY